MKKTVILGSGNSLFRFSLIFTLAIILTLGMIGCGDNKSDDKEDGDTPAPADVTLAQPLNLYFSTLQLDSATLVALLGENDEKKVRKIIVQVANTSATDTALGLIAYGATKKNEKVTGPHSFTVLSNPATNLGFPLRMGDQELSLKAIKDVLEITGGGHIPPASLKHFRFVPQKDGNNHLFYTVTRIAGAAGSANTNPSPPATPCEAGCDY